MNSDNLLDDLARRPDESADDRLERIGESIRAFLHAEALLAVADPTQDFGPEDVTTFRVVVEIEPPEVDDDGVVWAPESITARAYDLGHHSNVLFVEATEHGYLVG